MPSEAWPGLLTLHDLLGCTRVKTNDINGFKLFLQVPEVDMYSRPHFAKDNLGTERSRVFPLGFAIQFENTSKAIQTPKACIN